MGHAPWLRMDRSCKDSGKGFNRRKDGHGWDIRAVFSTAMELIHRQLGRKEGVEGGRDDWREAQARRIKCSGSGRRLLRCFQPVELFRADKLGSGPLQS